jgi:hypothetical protein
MAHPHAHSVYHLYCPIPAKSPLSLPGPPPPAVSMQPQPQAPQAPQAQASTDGVLEDLHIDLSDGEQKQAGLAGLGLLGTCMFCTLCPMFAIPMFCCSAAVGYGPASKAAGQASRAMKK